MTTRLFHCPMEVAIVINTAVTEKPYKSYDILLICWDHPMAYHHGIENDN